ncbi:MAG: UDP-2,4-diacetamido-2,4,6-trideoxy-beta-L-altropyranose hydrolase [Bacillota bacterium]
MNVVIRTDASVQIGSGHVMRCLTLASQLRGKGARVSFVCRELTGNLCSLAEEKGFRVYRLPYSESLSGDNMWEADAEQTAAVLKRAGNIGWLILDHYALDSRWESQMRPNVKNIMVIDDMADRPHDCDLLLDQNLSKNMETRYEGLVPVHCRKLLGPRYALLRPEFREARKHLRERGGSVRRILVFFGGSDPTNETAKALEAIRRLNRPDIAVDVVVGGANPHKEQIKQLCSVMPSTTFYCQVDNMAELMARADLAIGAGGTATLERCFLGLPSIVLVVAQNQYETAAAVADAGALWVLGWFHEVSVERIQQAVARAVGSPEALREMGKKAVELMGNHQYDVLQALMEVSHAGD